VVTSEASWYFVGKGRSKVCEVIEVERVNGNYCCALRVFVIATWAVLRSQVKKC
jgi:hypothetical protein